LSPGAYGVLQVLRSFQADDGAEALATEIAALYSDDTMAPSGWHMKDGLRKTLRQRVRSMAHAFGPKDLKGVPEQVEEFARKHFAKA
jgi:type I restriction enzyme R subunit